MVARRHHYVPQCYLNAFAVPHKRKQKPQLLVFDAVEAKCFRGPPDKVALETDFNLIDLCPLGMRHRVPVTDGAVGEQRGVAPPARIEQRGVAADIQKGFLLPCEASVR